MKLYIKAWPVLWRCIKDEVEGFAPKIYAKTSRDGTGKIAAVHLKISGSISCSINNTELNSPNFSCRSFMRFLCNNVKFMEIG